MTPAEKAAITCLERLDSGFFKALGEPARVALLRALILKQRADVGSLADMVPQERSVVTRHLQVMERARLVRSEAEGRHTYYAIDNEGVLAQLKDLVNLFESLGPLCCPPGKR
ncbi:metalloregulator ArsR/SmtB family transcription factor [Hydrogenophaga sp. 5NK40-0174]|uniref:ArsR/SmtB family transcription factor n=1 Tax=Hydrogenophaga sp. 5NK40-0174 TaxID=3127649 RepID=UPI00310B8E46